MLSVSIYILYKDHNLEELPRWKGAVTMAKIAVITVIPFTVHLVNRSSCETNSRTSIRDDIVMLK